MGNVKNKFMQNNKRASSDHQTRLYIKDVKAQNIPELLLCS